MTNLEEPIAHFQNTMSSALGAIKFEEVTNQASR